MSGLIGTMVVGAGTLIGLSKICSFFMEKNEEQKRMEELSRTEELEELGKAESEREDASAALFDELDKAAAAREGASVEPSGDSDPQSEYLRYKAEVTNQTMEKMMETLVALGCQPKVDGDRTISVQYQGENLTMDFEGYHVRVVDPAWDQCEMGTQEVNLFIEAANATNFNYGPTVILGIVPEEQVMYVNTRYDIMIHPTFPEWEKYVQSVLDSFFWVKRAMKNNMNQVIANYEADRNQEEQRRRPVGFDTSEA